MKIFDYSINLFDQGLITKKQIGVRETKDYYVSANNWLPVSYGSDCALNKKDMNDIYSQYGSSLHVFSRHELNEQKLNELKIRFIAKIIEIINREKEEIIIKENIVKLLTETIEK